MLDEWPDTFDHLDNVQDLLDLGLIDDAQATLDEHYHILQTYWEYHFLYSRIHTERNDPRRAVSCLLHGLRLEQDNVDCLIGLFYAHAMMNRVKRGGKFLIRAEELYPSNEYVISALIWYYTEINTPEKAIEYFERAQELHTNNPETYRNAGIAFDRLGRFEEAGACYKAAMYISPGFEEVRDLYADHLIFVGKTEEAVRLYEDALRESPKNIRHTSKLIYCLSQMNQFDKAEALAQHSITLYPNSPLAYIDLAYVYLNTGNLDEAAVNADKAISVSPIDAEGYRVKAIACSERGDFDIAEALFEKAASLDPEGVDILRDYYRHLRAAEKYEEMIEVIEKVVKLEYPYCTEDYWFLADFYRENKQNLKAFRYLRLAYESMPTEKELLPPMIEILLEQGHTKYSLPIFASYVQKSGWTDAMSGFMMNKQFKDRHIQEGMRFLRFTGQRPMEFRTFIFKHYFLRFGFMYYTLIIASLLLPASILFGWRGIGWVAAAYVVSLGLIKIRQIINFKKAADRAAQPQVAKGVA